MSREVNYNKVISHFSRLAFGVLCQATDHVTGE